MNRYYRHNRGFRQWVKANEEWFKRNPDVFDQLLADPNMVNLFMDLMVLNRAKIKRKLGRVGSGR